MELLKKLTRNNKRKFYNRYLYKVSLNVPGITAIRSISAEKFLELDLDDQNSPYNRNYWFSNCVKDRTDIDRVCRFLLKHNQLDLFTRLERNQIDLYTNDKNIFDVASLEFVDLLRYRSEPRLDIGSLNSIPVKKLPHGKFKYKVFLKPHRIKDKESKYHYLRWLESQKSHILMSESVKSWFIHTNWNWDRRYMWVEDEATLLLLKLRNPEVLGSVHTYQEIE